MLPAERLFRLVKQKSYPLARKLLSANLSESVDDDGLAAFFVDYTAIFPADFAAKENTYKSKNAFYLVTAEGNGTLFYFESADGLIDNIVEDG